MFLLQLVLYDTLLYTFFMNRGSNGNVKSVLVPFSNYVCIA